MLDQQNHAAGGANSSIMVGMFVCLCLASKKPSEREFFIPAGTDLGVKLLVLDYGLICKNNPKWGLVSLALSPDGHLICCASCFIVIQKGVDYMSNQ